MHTWAGQRSIYWKQEAVLILMQFNPAFIIRSVFFSRDLTDVHIQPFCFDVSAGSLLWITRNANGKTAMVLPCGC